MPGDIGSNMSVPRVDLSGTSYEIGFQHGTLLRKQIISQRAIYQTIFKRLANLEWPQVLEYAKTYQTTIERLAPDLYAEIEGITAGVGGEVSLLDIVALNARSEIALGTFDDGCTSLAWTIKPGDASQFQYLCQNWDWKPAVGKNLAMASITKPGKPKIWMVIEPGIVGKIGFNSSSVGVCLNAIRARPTKTDLLPIHLLLRIALECTSVEEAIDTFEKLGGPASSQHILIADATSGSRGLEVSPVGSIYLKPDSNDILVHTNHFIENKFVEEPPWLPSSGPRCERARELSENLLKETEVGKVTPQLLRQRIFSDTNGDPNGICTSNGTLVETLFNIVMRLEHGKEPSAEVTFGRPGTESASPVLYMPW